MICGKCGKPLYEGDDFCVYCGANRSATAIATENRRKVAVYKAVICVAVVVALVAGVGLIGWYTGYEYAVKKYFTCIENDDGVRMCDRVYLSSRKEYYDYKYGDGNTEENDKRVVDRKHEVFSEKYGPDFRISYEIVDAQRITGSELDSLQSRIRDLYSYSGNNHGRAIRITDAYEAEVSYAIKGSKDEAENETTFTIVKENGKWRIW